MLVAPPGCMVFQSASQDTAGLRWGVAYPGAEDLTQRRLADLILAHPALQEACQGKFRDFLTKAAAAAAASADQLATLGTLASSLF